MTFLGPPRSDGAVVDDWAPYGPVWDQTTGSPTVGDAVIAGKWRRVGDSVEVKVLLEIGAGTALGSGLFIFSLPPGLTIDYSKLNPAPPFHAIAGNAHMQDVSAPSANATGYITSDPGGFPDFIAVKASDAPSDFVDTGTPFTWAVGDKLELDAVVPIIEFAGSQVLERQPLSHWEAFTPTFEADASDVSGDLNLQEGFWRRVGDSAEIRVNLRFSGSISSTGTLKIGLPSGLTLDAAKVPTPGAHMIVGSGHLFDNSAHTNDVAVVVDVDSADDDKFRMQIASGASSPTVTDANPSFGWETSDQIRVQCSVPIIEFRNLALEVITISPATLTGDVNDYAPAGLETTSFVRVDTGAALRNITGIAAPAGDRKLTIVNVGATFDLVLKHEDVLSVAANRFAIGGALDFTMAPGGVATLFYDGTSSKWRLT